MKLEKQGKVCDIYRVDGDPSLRLHHRTDRFSVGDVCFEGTVKNKGTVLTQMSWNWKQLLWEHLEIPNDLVSQEPDDLIKYGVPNDFASFAGSSVIVKQCIPIPLECIVRGYYIPESKSWDPYKKNGNMYGNELPLGLKESQKLPAPIYTPSTKAAYGEHDRNISFDETIDILAEFIKTSNDIALEDSADINLEAKEIAEQLKDMSLEAYKFAHEYALRRGIILADTKLEFGLWKDDKSGKYIIVLIDEVFTPDSSRFWSFDLYEIGKPQPSMDKQYLRRAVRQTGWDGKSIPPVLSKNVLDKQAEIYGNIYQELFSYDIVEVKNTIMWKWKKAEKRSAL